MKLARVANQYGIGINPDCIAKRSGEEVGIEFEVRSGDFFAYKNDRDRTIYLIDDFVI